MIWLWFPWSLEAPLDLWEEDPESTVGYGQPPVIEEELGFIMENDMTSDSSDQKSEDEL